MPKSSKKKTGKKTKTKALTTKAKTNEVDTTKMVNKVNKATETETVMLVKMVSEYGCEKSFIKLKAMLDPYIKLFGQKYKIAGHDKDEIEQECVIALYDKAIRDFNPERGKFRSFAILCIKRHLFSLIKGSNQQKRKVLNQSVSLYDDRSNDSSEGENLSLVYIVTEDAPTNDEQISNDESIKLRRDKILAKLSPLEREVYKLYIQRYHYDEIVDELLKIFPKNKKLSKKTVDNSLQRIRTKLHKLFEEGELFEEK